MILRAPIRNLPTLLLLFLLIALLFPGCSRGEEPSVRQLDLAVRLEPATQSLSGTATAHLVAGGPEVSFFLAPQARIGRVAVAGNDAAYRFNGGRLTVTLPPKAGTAPSVVVEYEARFADPVPTRIASFEDPSYGVSATITTRGTFLGGEANWYPNPAAPPGELTVSVTAPAGIEAITQGERISHQTTAATTSSTWLIRRPHTPLELSAGPYLIREQRQGKVTIYTYFFQDNDGLAPGYLAAVADYLRYYEGLFGPYPFEKFAVVENFLPTGYGLPSYTLLGSGVIRLPFILQTSLPHEIAHCWWGNGVLVDYDGGNWSEGLATYVADHLVLERQSPAEARDYRQRLLNDYAALVTPGSDLALRQFTRRSDPASRAVGYGKSAMVFHQVRLLLGDEAFFKALREVAGERLFQRAGWQDFVRVFSRAAGRDLAPWFDQWLTRQGGPRLALADVRLKRDGPHWLVEGQVRQEPPFYDLSVPLELTTAGEPLRQNLSSREGMTPFRFRSTSRPSRLVLDPQVGLFRAIPREELPATVNRLKGSRQLTVIVAGTGQPDESLSLLLESMGHKSATVVAERDLAGRLPEGDLLWYGLPERRELLAGLPDQLRVAAKQFTINGQEFDQAGDALFLVTSAPRRPDRVTALYLPLSTGAAVRSAPKITHYGRYGYLVFRNGENRLKGLFPPDSSSTAVSFSDGPAS